MVSAYPVEDPSKFQSGRSSKQVTLELRVQVLDLVLIPEPSIHTYSANTFPH